MSEQETVLDETTAPTVAAADLVATVEAMLFVSSEPVTIRQLQGALPGTSRELLRESMDLLARQLDEAGRGIHVQEVGGGFRLATKSAFDPVIRALTTQKKKHRLSQAARETLAIIAYKQPITGPEITEIRGVDCASALKGLLERKLARIMGRKEVVGRPILYGTTREFLLLFGLKSLEELPTLEDFEDLTMTFAPGEGPAEPADTASPDEIRDLVRAQDARQSALPDSDDGNDGDEGEEGADGKEAEDVPERDAEDSPYGSVSTDEAEGDEE